MGFEIDPTAKTGWTEPGASRPGWPDAGRYLGAARVLRADGPTLRLELPEQPGKEVCARLAMPFVYAAEAGDEVLAIGMDGQWFVIGVLDGRGKTSLVAPGDVEIAAPRGRITLSAGTGIALKAPSLRTVARTVEVTAMTLVEHAQTASRWVAGLFDLRASQTTIVTEGTHQVRARNIIESAEEQVRIDGEIVKMG